MAMQAASMGLSRIFVIVGVGFTGTIMVKNGKLSDILGELQSLIKSMENSGDSGDTDYSEALAAQIRRLAADVRSMASSRQITVLNGNSAQGNLTSLAAPAAALGALSYGYMWWKGLSFSDLLYVTKHSMATAVANLTTHLENVSEAVAVTKRHLTEKIMNLDGKLDEQVEVSRLIRTEVTEVHDDLSQIGFDLEALQRSVSSLNYQLRSIENKQNVANIGIMYLVNLVTGRNVKMPAVLQDQLKMAGRASSLAGLKEIADLLPCESYLLTNESMADLLTNGSMDDLFTNESMADLFTNGSMADSPDTLNIISDTLRETLTRTYSTVC